MTAPPRIAVLLAPNCVYSVKPDLCGRGYCASSIPFLPFHLLTLPREFRWLSCCLTDCGLPRYSVKWHLGFTTWKHTPTFRGFSSFYGYYGCAEDYFTHSDPLRNTTFGIDFHEDNGIDCGGPPFPRCSRPALEAVAHGLACYAGEGTPGHVPQLCWATGKAPPAVPSDAKRCCYGCDDTDHYSTTLIARRATAIITNHNTSMPLFLYLPFQETHGPAEVPLYWRAMVDEELVPNPVRRELFGKLRALDSAFKNITQALKSHPDGDMLANTIWIYTTGELPRGGVQGEDFVLISPLLPSLR